MNIEKFMAAIRHEQSRQLVATMVRAMNVPDPGPIHARLWLRSPQ
ncbi:hypothetical protein [Sphingomonas sp. LK11]|jgi:hypothetical protein|nr:hypothetical protein [Sphingomonas sp. LK11]